MAEGINHILLRSIVFRINYHKIDTQYVYYKHYYCVGVRYFTFSKLIHGNKNKKIEKKTDLFVCCLFVVVVLCLFILFFIFYCGGLWCVCLYSKRKGVYCLFFVFLHEGIIQQKNPE